MLAPNLSPLLKAVRKPHSGVSTARARHALLPRHLASLMSLARNSPTFFRQRERVEPGSPGSPVMTLSQASVRHGLPLPKSALHAALGAWYWSVLGETQGFACLPDNSSHSSKRTRISFT